MSSKYYGWEARVAAEIAAERRPPAPQVDALNVLKTEIVRARLALAGVTDPTEIAAVAKRVQVSSDGSLVGLTAEGARGVGSGPDYGMTLDDLLAEHGKARTETITAAPPDNPFAKGPGFNITHQMRLLTTDPERAAHLQYLAALGKH